MLCGDCHGVGGCVALRKESVDRNSFMASWMIWWSVALRKESVDRNTVGVYVLIMERVALRKESVDRNKIKDNRKPPPRRRSPQGERG